MPVLVSLFVTSRNLSFGVFLSKKTSILVTAFRVSTESWESWGSWEIEQSESESHGIFFFFEKSWEIHGIFISMMRCTIWYHLYNLKNVKNTVIVQMVQVVPNHATHNKLHY